MAVHLNSAAVTSWHDLSITPFHISQDGEYESKRFVGSPEISPAKLDILKHFCTKQCSQLN